MIRALPRTREPVELLEITIEFEIELEPLPSVETLCLTEHVSSIRIVDEAGAQIITEIRE